MGAPNDWTILAEDLLQSFHDEVSHSSLVVLWRKRAESIPRQLWDEHGDLVFQLSYNVPPHVCALRIAMYHAPYRSRAMIVGIADDLSARRHFRRIALQERVECLNCLICHVDCKLFGTRSLNTLILKSVAVCMALITSHAADVSDEQKLASCSLGPRLIS